LKAEVLYLNEKVTRLEARETPIQIFVKWIFDEPEWNEVYHIQNTKTIFTLLQEVNKKKNGKWSISSKNRRLPYQDLNLNSTFLKEGISPNTTLYVWK